LSRILSHPAEVRPSHDSACITENYTDNGKFTFDIRGSMHHSTIHKEKFNKMQQGIKILLFHIFMKLNMFLATHGPSSGA
jgi:hypothetical protein